MFEPFEEPVELWPGVHRQIQLYGERIMLIRITLAAGSFVEPHTHPHEQITHLVTGCLAFYLQEEESILHASESLLVPGNVRHSVEALEESVALDIFSPPREDYLE